MGDIHASLGLTDEARREYGQARNTKNYSVRIYNLACRRLAAGRLEEARRAFDEVKSGIAFWPAERRATVLRDVAWQYFRNGHYREAVAEGEVAIGLEPGHRETQFRLAASYLAGGEFARANSVYAEAVGRYGRDEMARDILRELIRRGVRAEAARRALDVHFGVAQR